MQARATVSWLLALTLVAGLVIAPPAAADDAPPVVDEVLGELPEDGVGDDDTGDGAGGGGSGGEGDSDHGGPGVTPFGGGAGDGAPMSPLPLPAPLERSFASDEPSALFGVEDFPLPDQVTLDQWASRGITPQQRPMTVHSVIATDLNGDTFDDVVSLVHIGDPDVQASLRSPGRAFARDVSVPEADLGKGGWYVVVHLGSEIGITKSGAAYLVGSDGFIGAIAVGDVTATDDLNAPDIVYTNHRSGVVLTLVNDGDGAFGKTVSTPLSTKFDRGITLGNIDGDEHLDFVASSTDNSAGTIFVAVGNGEGGFIPEAQFAFSDPANIALIDSDGSDRPEILTTSFDTGTNAALWRWTQPDTTDTETSNGWAKASDAGALSTATAAAAWVGDFDGEHGQDVAVFLRDCFDGQAPHCLLPLRNDGSGKFTALSAVAVPPVSPYGNRFSSISFPKVDGRTTDINGDNRPDIVLPGGAGEVAVLLADGSGGFRDVQVYAGTAGWEPALENGWDNTDDEYSNASWPGQWGSSYQANSVAVGDVTGDGRLDLLVATGSGTASLGDAPGQLAVVAGVGSGTFAAATAQAVSDTWRQPDFRRDWITTARWNDDEYDDLVFLTGGDVMVAPGRQGGFERETRVGAAPAECVARYVSRMVVSDVNGDGNPDLVCGGSSAFHIMYGDGSGTLDAATQLGTLAGADAGAEGTHLLALADVDGDEQEDLVFSTSIATGQTLTSIAFGWMQSLESGSFAAPKLLVTSAKYRGGTAHRIDPDIPFRPVVADFNGDGRADFALAARVLQDQSGTQHDKWGRYDLLTFLSEDKSQEPGYVEAAQDVYLELWYSHLGLLDTADLNGDHKPDLILTGLENASSGEFKSARRLLLGTGDGTFTAGQRLPTGAGWPGARVADLNGDGNVDLVSPTGYRGVELRAGKGDGTFGTPQLFGTPGVALGWVDLVDVDNDGVLDVIGSIRETVGSTHSDSLADPDQIAIMINGGEAVDPGDPTCEPDDEECQPVCDPEINICDPPVAPTINLTVKAPTWPPDVGALTAITQATVTVTVTNSGNTAITKPWTDALWLSSSAEGGLDSDILLKALPRNVLPTDSLAPGQTLTDHVSVTVAPPAEGTYYLVVKADARGQLAETILDDDGAPVPAEADNSGASDQIVFDPPILEIPASGDHPGAATTVTGPGAVVRIPEIEDGTSAVRLTVTGAEVDGFAVRTGKLPTATLADQRIVGAGSATLLPGTARYLRIDLGAGESATVTAARLEFGVGSVAPKRVSVGGPVSFVLTGVRLGSLNSAWAIGPDDDEIPATALMRHSSGELTVTFDLTGQEAGTFGLRVESADTSATLDGAFVAVADRVGGVRTSVLIPSTLRSGTVGEVWITFANDGLTDAVAPILRVSSRGVKPTETSPYPLGRFYVSPSVSWAPVGVIPAGASGRIVIPFLVNPDGPDSLPNLPPDGNQYTFYVEEFGIDSVAPYNAAADFAEDLLEIADDGGRTAIALELISRLGETGGSYLAAMHRLRATLDPPTADMDELREKIFENVVGVFGSGAVHGTLTKSGSPVKDVGLQIDVPAGTDGAGARTVETRTDETGAWFARGLTEATGAVVRVDGYGPGPIMGLPDLSASSTVNLTLPDWQPLSGTVTGLDGLFAPDVVVTVQSGDGTQWVRAVTDTDGVYRFDGIAPGTHRLMAAGMDGGLAITDLTMGDAAITKNLTLQSTGIAADGGSVTGTLPPMPITAVLGDVEIPDSVSIWVDDGASLRPIETETDGSFTVVGTPGTHATLWLFDAFYGVRSAAVTFPAAGARVGAAWTTSDRTLAIPVTVTTGDELPQVYLQLAASADYVPIPGADAGVLLVPSGLDGDPVTWTDETSAGDRGMLSVANLPPGDYRVTVIDSDGEDIAEFSVAAGDVAVSFGARPESVTASGTATHNGTTVVGGFVELVSTNLSPARRHVAPTGGPDTDPPGTAGAWSVSVVVGEYDVRYFDASGTLLYSEVKSFLEGSPLRMSGRAFAHAPTTASVAGRSSYLLSRSASAVSAFSTDGEYAPQGGSKAELEAIYQAKFDSGTVPTPDPMVGQALAMPYPNQPPPDECKALDTSWLAAAKIAASTAASTREMIDQLIRDTRKTKAWMFGEAALRAVMFLGEISNLVLGVIAVKQAVGKAAATAAAREEAKVLAAKGIKPPPPTGIIDVRWQPVLENIQKVSSLGSTIYTNAKTAITSAEPAVAGNVVGMLGEIGNLALELSKDIGIMATSAAVSLVRDVIGPIAAINNMITQVREAGESYRSAIAQLDNMKAALDQLYVSYDFDLGQAHQAWFDFQANRFPEISLDTEECEEGDGGDDEDPKGPGEDPDDPNDPAGPKEPTKPTGPKPGPKQPTGPTGGRTLGSMDPNEIVGPAGVGSERWLQVGTVLGYRISFENLGPGSLEIPDDQEMATAPAATVTVAFPLPDAALVDSVELGDFGFGVGDGAVRYVPHPGAASYERADGVSMTVPSVFDGAPDVTVDLVRRARGWLDRDGREVHWEITLVGKTTGLPHSNPAAGFLPPEPGGDNAGAGQGWATVSFATDAAAPVDARASIVFDTNDPILTNIWSNRLDGTAPSTSMSGASTTVVGQTAAVTLNDAGGSGAGLVDIWRSVDDGPLRLWRYQVPPGPQVMLGEPGQRIGLAARSTDRVGNAEHPPSAIQFSTTLKAAPRPGGPTPGGPTPGGIDPGQPGATPQADRCAVKPFLDVRIGDAFCGEIAWLKSTGITKGYGSGAFGATAAVSRGAMAAFLYRLQHPGADKPVCSTAPFPDVSVDSAFCGEIAWLKSTGITVGYSDGKFHATRAVSRSAMAAFLYRLHHPTTAPVGCAAQPFRDVPRAAEFCAEITWLTVEGLTTGFSDGTYRGLLPVSRGAMAAFLYRLEHAND